MFLFLKEKELKRTLTAKLRFALNYIYKSAGISFFPRSFSCLIVWIAIDKPENLILSFLVLFIEIQLQTDDFVYWNYGTFSALKTFCPRPKKRIKGHPFIEFQL